VAVELRQLHAAADLRSGCKRESDETMMCGEAWPSGELVCCWALLQSAAAVKRHKPAHAPCPGRPRVCG
jgi:hypothetical protein